MSKKQNGEKKRVNWKVALGITGGLVAVGGGVFIYSKMKKNPVTSVVADEVAHKVVEHAGDIVKVVEF